MVREIDRFEVLRLMGRDAQVVDVLPAADYERQHIIGAISMPLHEFGADVLTGLLDKNRPVITYCCDAACDRSGRAAARLRTLGFTEVYNYQPSMVDWLGNGLPIEGTEADRPRLGDLARADVPTCRPDETIGDVRMRLGDWDVCTVVDQDEVVVGLLPADALAVGGDQQDQQVADLMQEGPTTYRPDVPLERAAEMLRDRQEPRVIVSNADGVMVGIADPKAVRRMAEDSTS